MIKPIQLKVCCKSNSIKNINYQKCNIARNSTNDIEKIFFITISTLSLNE